MVESKLSVPISDSLLGGAVHNFSNPSADALQVGLQDVDELVLESLDFQDTSQGLLNTPGSMSGDVSNQTTTLPNRSRPTRRRTVNPGNVGRPLAGRSTPSTQSPPSGSYFPATPGSDAVSTVLPSQPSAFQYPSGFPYPNQAPGFYASYSLPSHPPPLNIGQAHPIYRYPHALRCPPIPDGGGLISVPVQHNYAPHIHPNQQPYHFSQQHSDDGTHPPTSFSNSQAVPSTFGHHRPHGTPIHSPTDRGNHPLFTPSYLGSPHFHGMPYPLPVGSPQYGYTQPYPSPQLPFQPYGAPLHYPHHPSSPHDVDNQPTHGSWYFLPNSPPPPQHHENIHPRQSHQFQFPVQQHEGRAQAYVSSSPTPASTPHLVRVFEPPASVISPAATSGPSSTAGENSPVSSVAPQQATSMKAVVRREWHPRPPLHRSQWVMWVGNVPSDATQEDLWIFFTSLPDDGSLKPILNAGVESIFLIARSNCAFINYISEELVQNAIQRFNGLRLRPTDPQCPMLVCKIRQSADDLKSGVGGQRGMGIHKQWVQAQDLQPQTRTTGAKSEVGSTDGHAGSGANRLVTTLISNSVSHEPRGRERGTQTSTSSGSHSSTTSSFLAEYFPTRFFILKSLSEDDLNISVQNGLWATQKHNELLLDQAFRTAKDVYLIFSVNKSGEFYGYARMAGPIRRGEGSVEWVARSEGSISSPNSPIWNRHQAASDTYFLGSGFSDTKMFFSPDGSHVVDSSPLQLDRGEEPLSGTFDPRIPQHQSAPPNFGGSETVRRTPSLKFSLDHYELRQSKPQHFELDGKAPIRAMRGTRPSATDGGGGGGGGDDDVGSKAKALPPVDEKEDQEGYFQSGLLDKSQDTAQSAPTWGECFKIEWLERRKIPFHRTRHLRNSWNKGREIKISRDGTELEPNIGKRLLDEWSTLADP